MSAWVKQIASQVEKYGKEKASWYCEWREPDKSLRCKSCGAGVKGKRLAETMAKQIRAQLLTGTYKRNRDNAKTWDDFVEQYRTKVLSGLATTTMSEADTALAHFRRVANVGAKTLAAISTETIDGFRSIRRTERGKKPGSLIAAATVNKDLRHVKAALRVAHEWGYLERMPKVKFERERRTLPSYVTPEHFAAIYTACDAATLPAEMHVPARDWWRGLLVFAQMTGWRISEILALEWVDVDLEAGTAITRAADNKGKRDEAAALHSIVVDHIRPLKAFHPNVFPWENDRKLLTNHFHAIQAAAGIDLPCRVTGKTGAELRPQFNAKVAERWDRLTTEDLASVSGHVRRLTNAVRRRYSLTRAEASRQVDAFSAELVASREGHYCTPSCHKYGFHDERRSFATMNAANMTRESLQALMRHQSSLTTERYINFARQIKPAIANLHVPDVLKISNVG